MAIDNSVLGGTLFRASSKQHTLARAQSHGIKTVLRMRVDNY